MKIRFDQLTANTYIGVKGNRYFMISKQDKKEKEITPKEFYKFCRNNRLNDMTILPNTLTNRGYNQIWKVSNENIAVTSDYVVGKIKNMLKEIQSKEPLVQLKLKQSNTTQSLYIVLSCDYYAKMGYYIKQTEIRVSDHESGKNSSRTLILNNKDINMPNLRKMVTSAIERFKKKIILTLMNKTKNGGSCEYV